MGSGEAAFVFISLYLLAIGIAGIKAALPSLGADQFDPKDPNEATQMSGFFNFFLLATCIGSAVSLTFFVWIQDHRGWDLGFTLAAITMLIGLIIFVARLPMYRMQVINGTGAMVEIIQVLDSYKFILYHFIHAKPSATSFSLMSTTSAIFRFFIAAFGNKNLKLPDDPQELYEIEMDKEDPVEAAEFLPHGDIYRFLDKAAIRQTSDRQYQAPNPWKLCRVTQVENAKIVLGMVPVFLCTIIMSLCLAQLQTFSIQQGQTMDTTVGNSFKIPPASLPILPIIFLIIIVPFYDRIVVPILRKITGIPTGITHLQRVGVGLVLACLSMATAAIMEVKRKQVARDHHMLDAVPVLQPLPISVFWLSFQFFIFGIADMFTYVGLLEFFYSEAPKPLKSVSTCFVWSSTAVGYFLNSVLVKIVNRATKDTKSGGWLAGNNINRNHLNLFFWLLSALSLINFVVYLCVATRYKYRPLEVEARNSATRTHPENELRSNST